MGDMIPMVQTVLDPLQTLTLQAVTTIPSVLGALLLLLGGSFIGRWLRGLLESVLGMTKLDAYSEKVGLGEVLEKLGLGNSPTVIMGFLVYWLVFLAFLLSAANVVRLTVVSEFLEQVVLFLPKMIAAILVLGGGSFLGHFAAGVVLNSAKANKIKGAAALSKLTHGILVVFAGVMALQRLGIDTTILSQSIQLIIGSVGFGAALAFGISFGLAGKAKAEAWLEDTLKKH